LGTEEAHWRAQNSQLAEDEARWKQLLDNARSPCGDRRRAPRRSGGEVARCRECGSVRRRRGHRGTPQPERGRAGLRLAEADKGHALRALDNLVQRRSRLEQDRQALGAPDPALLAASKESEERAEAALAVAQERLAALQAAIPAAEAQLRAAREALQAAHRSLTETRARHDALAQLQAKVAQSGEIGDWLKARNLADAKPLWQAIQVEAGWETAVEAVLRERFSALVADADRRCARP
jgi:chromosome segregation protein